ncbi:hypothetical protein AV530_011224 [Patagioenas fasciata monilis]|uniref:Uncharacterized protein n=1 Tax=Patagioenas fasciata monilis TaxID=372326 RepID=A0A1V4KNI2_PATFA|nr:hypothetical protein AV530_011224 [Patagioenas fasciata monilis]
MTEGKRYLRPARHPSGPPVYLLLNAEKRPVRRSHHPGVLCFQHWHWGVWVSQRSQHGPLIVPVEAPGQKQALALPRPPSAKAKTRLDSPAARSLIFLPHRRLERCQRSSYLCHLSRSRRLSQARWGHGRTCWGPGARGGSAAERDTMTGAPRCHSQAVPVPRVNT